MPVTNTLQQQAHRYGIGKTFEPWSRWSHSMHKPEWTWWFFPSKRNALAKSVKSYSRLKERRSLLLAIGTTAVPESCSPERTAACCHPSCTGDFSAEGKMSPKGLANHGEETRSPAGSSRFLPAQYWPPLQQVDERFLKRIRLYKITSLHTYLVTPHFY